MKNSSVALASLGAFIALAVPVAAAAPPVNPAWKTLTSQSFSIWWATWEFPWYPVGMAVAAYLGYIVGREKGPSLWAEEGES